MSDKTTCQICARRIKAAKGVIAHHGYKRPGGGWQTGSCFGARHLPYEVSCDVIPLAIANTERQRERTVAALEKLRTSPPDRMSYIKRGYDASYRQTQTLVEVPRPDGFDPKTCRNNFISGSYVGLYLSAIKDDEFAIQDMTAFLKYLNERLANWKPVRTGG